MFFAEYTHLRFGRYKGNSSRDGTKLVVRATNRQGEFVAFAYGRIRAILASAVRLRIESFWKI
jgi:hypothetical protein